MDVLCAGYDGPVRITSSDLRFWLTDEPYIAAARQWAERDWEQALEYLEGPEGRGYQAGSEVNLEVDLIARYLERLLMKQDDNSSTGITLESLAKAGFVS